MTEKDDKDNRYRNTASWKKEAIFRMSSFYYKSKENQMSFLVSFYGNFTVNDLDKLWETGRSFSDKK